MKAAKIITGVIVVLFVALVVGIIYRFTNGFNEEFKTFYLERDGKRILTAETNEVFVRGESYRYEVKYTFDSGSGEPKGYGVKVVPNEAIELTFQADGKRYSYASAKELTEAFEIEREESAFTITLPETLTLQSILEKVYGKAVEVEDQNGYLYTLVVTSYNEAVTYKINFGIAVNVEGIETDKGGVIFGVNSGTPPKDDGDDSVTEDEESRAYAITYEIAYSYADTPIQTECPTQARAGEIVTLTAVPDVRYEDYGVWAEVYDRASGEYMYSAQTVSYGCITFEMPECDVLIKIYHV